MNSTLITELDQANLQFDAAMNRFLIEAQKLAGYQAEYEQLLARHAEARAAAVSFVMEAAMLRRDVIEGRTVNEIVIAMT